jgi:photosystem II stability/assembly factor-like uncharacterized protein
MANRTNSFRLHFVFAAVSAITLLMASSAAAQHRPTRSVRAKAAPPSAEHPAVTYTGIWEPVNYPHDIELTDVFFVSVDEGWAAGGRGGGGVLIHTTDGGAHWEEVLGDPEGSQSRFYGLQFVDQTTGFVAQVTGVGDHSLARTTDGRTWTVTGTVPQHHADFRFVSATVGVAAADYGIVRTTDAGRSWKRVFDCRLSVQVNGLSRQVQCEAASFSFPSPTVGFAIGDSPQAKGIYVFRTDDAGQSWKVWLAVPGDDGREGHVFFIDEHTGYLCAGGRLFGTQDGGQTWTGLPGASCPGKPQLLFADPEVGWALRYGTLTYTTNGGQRWVSREIRFPASVYGFSFPRRDRGYAVGEHGLIYRYRVVPTTAPAPTLALAAPAMPGFSTALGSNADGIEQQVGALATIFGGQDDTAATAFLPDTASIPFVSGSASDASGAFDGGASPSPFIAKCCIKRLSGLELIVKAVGGLVPDFLSRYRNLNIVAQGLRTAAALPDELDNLRTSLRTFQSATDRPTAQQALDGIKRVMAGFHAAVDTALQQPTSPFPGGSQ